MYFNFFQHIDIDPKNVHILNGNANDLAVECDQFEKQIELAGGIELFIGGIGPGNMINVIYLIIKHSTEIKREFI